MYYAHTKHEDFPPYAFLQSLLRRQAVTFTVALVVSA